MRLERKNSVFNMGDTSIRVKQVVEVNKIILEQLNAFMKQDIIWQGNRDGQESFYRLFIKEIVRLEDSEGIELFTDFKRLKHYNAPNKNKVGLRGRTLTNSLVKSGLIDSERNISEVGKMYLEDDLKESDLLEDLLSLSKDNLLYFRQHLKLRIYSSEDNKYFYNFRFTLKFLSNYKDVPQDDLLTIVESIRPSQGEEELNLIIENYQDVDSGLKTFKEYYSENFTHLFASEDELNEVKDMFLNKSFTDENFKKYFPNAKSSETSLLYKDFVSSIIKFKTEKTQDSLDKMIEISRDSKIKKAFSYGKLPFEFSKNDDVKTFLDKNASNPLLSADDYNIYLEFLISKQSDLIKEYSDMCRRYFQVTALISFDNGQANLTNKWIIKPLLEILGDRFNLSGEDSYSDYEENISSPWYSDLTTMNILGVTEADYNLLVKRLSDEFGEDNISKIPERVATAREYEFREFIYKEFPKHKVISILNEISSRNDSSVFEQVTDTATVPTIYEYILTIAWFHLSKEKDYYVHKSFGVSLDGNKLPLIHQGGGKGDIEVISTRYSLLIEATLMDISTQRRGELEPVIRHSINFNIDNAGSNTQTLFIANELDSNVLNIFRATQFIELNGTIDTNKNINGLNIFAFTTNELVNLLEKDIDDDKILSTINDNLGSSPLRIKNNWRQNVLDSLI